MLKGKREGGGVWRGKVRRLGLAQERTISPGGHKGPSKPGQAEPKEKAQQGPGEGRKGG